MTAPFTASVTACGANFPPESQAPAMKDSTKKHSRIAPWSSQRLPSGRKNVTTTISCRRHILRDLFDRHALGQVTRLVDVGATQVGHVVGEQL